MPNYVQDVTKLKIRDMQYAIALSLTLNIHRCDLHKDIQTLDSLTPQN